MVKAAKSVTTIARVSRDGSVSAEPSAKLRQSKMLLRPKVRTVVGKDKSERLVMLAKGGKKEKAVSVRLAK